MKNQYQRYKHDIKYSYFLNCHLELFESTGIVISFEGSADFQMVVNLSLNLR